MPSISCRSAAFGMDLHRFEFAIKSKTNVAECFRPEVTPAKATHAQIKWGQALFIAESFRWWDGDGVASGQQAGEQRADGEKRGCRQ